MKTKLQKTERKNTKHFGVFHIYHTPYPIHHTHTRTGFTLIEALIAIAVLLIAIVGPLTIATRGLTAAAFARDQIAAYYLAQEAVELIRNKRDNNHLANVDWKGGMDPCFETTGCYVDSATVDPIFTSCSESGCPLLGKSTTAGFYSYSADPGVSPSPFTRTIKMQNVSADEFSVSVTIAWRTGVIAKSFTIQDNFLNW